MSSIVIEISKEHTPVASPAVSQIKTEAEPGRLPTVLVAVMSAAAGFWALACLVGGLMQCGSFAATRDALITMLTGL